MISIKGIEWLEARGLDVELAVRLGVKSLKRNGCEWLEIPYIYRGDRVNAKFRNIEKKEHFQEPDGKKVVYNFDCLLDQSLEDQPLIITEGEWDCMAALQSGYARVISVPDGAPAEIVTDGSVKYSYLDEVLKIISDTKEVIIAADSDGPGNNLLHSTSPGVPMIS